ncbi:MAG: aminoacyl-tRNA hydrolase [Oscillospiraceae bacterium]|jgi:PTH1 family peptidyl-tRNA hydrolase|nr:aminoacyl-tRNA hydrolase [Oscillospiraceae bacterium]
MFRFNAPTAPPEWLIVFLGNPDARHELTRHNAGWIAADYVESSVGVRIRRAKFKSHTELAVIGGARVLLMKPMTYMNLSGEAVAAAVRFYKLAPERVVVVHDDLDLAPGKLRIKRGGSDGGHNGIKSVTAHLGTRDYPRIKLGIGKPSHPEHDRIDWVIGKLDKSSLDTLRECAELVPDVLETLIAHDVETAMNKFN